MKLGTRVKLALKQNTELDGQHGKVAIIPEGEGLYGIQLTIHQHIPDLTWNAADLIQDDSLLGTQFDLTLNEKTTIVWADVNSIVELPTFYYGQALTYYDKPVTYIREHSHPGMHKVEDGEGLVIIAFESGLRSKLVEITEEELIALGYKLKK